MLQAFPLQGEHSVRSGFSLVRVNGSSSLEDQASVESVMVDSGEPERLVEARFGHGDEFFGWARHGEVVSFGWVAYRDRAIGPIKLRDAIGRVFLYNFHTLQAYRGRGLYPTLLLAMRHVLGRERATEFIIDVAASNSSSVKGIEKAGFAHIAAVDLVTVMNRWEWACNATQRCGAAAALF